MKRHQILSILSVTTLWATLSAIPANSTLEKQGAIRVTTICGHGIFGTKKACEIYLLTEPQFQKWTRKELDDLKMQGLTPRELTNLSSGRYYVGVSAEIDRKVYYPYAGRPSDPPPPDLFEWSEEFFANDGYEARDGYISVVADRTQGGPRVGTFLRKWYSVNVHKGKSILVVAIFLPRKANLKDYLPYYPQTKEHKINMSSELIGQMGMKLSKFWGVTKEDWSTMVDLVSRGGKVAAHRGLGDCIVSLDLQGNLLITFPDVKLERREKNAITKVSEGSVRERGADTTPTRSATPKMLASPILPLERVLPSFDFELKGSNEVRIKNPNDFVVTVGLRSAGAGRNFEIPAHGRNSVFMPNGKYDIYFVYSNKPGALFKGDSFTLAGNGVEIQIAKVAGDNYRIRQVK